VRAAARLNGPPPASAASVGESNVGGGPLRRVLDIGNAVRTTRFVLHGEELEVESHELMLVLDAARWRHDVAGWRFTRSGRDGAARGFHRADLDDSAWTATSHLHPLYGVRYDGCAWFRHRFALPESEQGQTITLVLGGLDDEDWLRYRVFLNGEPVAEWEAEGRWREPQRILLAPELLRVGSDNVLAVETEGLARSQPGMRAGEDEHYFFQGWLLDQFLCSGAPYDLVRDFEVVDARDGRVEVEARGLRATLLYDARPDVLRKRVELVNETGAPLELLDVVLEDLILPVEVGKGGGGMPVLGERIFLGLEFPAGLNQGDGRRARVVQLPGVRLEDGARWTTEAAVIGCAPPGGSAAAAFRAYLRGLRPRPRRRLVVYSALGWYDFTNPADPLHELNADLVRENLAQLDELDEPFDVYVFDDWWEPSDPRSFRRTTFPEGGPAAAAEVRDHGLEAGLWVAPVSTGWGWGKAPGIERALAGGVEPAYERPADPDTGKWSWDEVFSQAFTTAPRFCLASEPLRGYLADALAAHARELGLACLKIDGVMTHCTSSEHGHRAGRYSVEPAARALIEAVQGAERERAGLAVIWYWGARSPWWLRYGDALFDKGLKLEAASPAGAPSFALRQSVTLNSDQAVRHAALVPLDLQDSLGVWLGNVAWANRIGSEWWRDAFVLDVARGSAIVQLWGDLTLLDDDDGAFLGAVLRFVRATDHGYETTVPVGGDPWLAEPYGYMRRCRDGAIVTVFNPSFENRVLRLDVRGTFAVHEAFPVPGPRGSVDSCLELTLDAFEVRCLQLHRGAPSEAAARPRARPSRPLDLSTRDVPLPRVDRGDWVVVAARLSREGVWWYHPEPHELVRLTARLRGAEVYVETLPRVASQNGPGYPWVVFRMPAGQSWSEQELRLNLRSFLPEDVELSLEGWVLEPWWLRRPGRFESIQC
jgi:hypothetical protein